VESLGSVNTGAGWVFLATFTASYLLLSEFSSVLDLASVVMMAGLSTRSVQLESWVSMGAGLPTRVVVDVCLLFFSC